MFTTQYLLEQCDEIDNEIFELEVYAEEHPEEEAYVQEEIAKFLQAKKQTINELNHIDGNDIICEPTE